MKRFVITAVVSIVALIGASRSSSQPELFSVTMAIEDETSIAKVAARGFDIAGANLEKKEFVVLTDAVGVRQLSGIKDIRVVSSEMVLEVLDKSYKKPADIERILKDTAAKFPALAAVDVIGKSTDGRDIHAIRLTDRFHTPAEEKPTILIDAMHHAREVMTPEVALDIVDYLTSRFATDPQVKAWMRNNEIWVVPMVNPDGNDKVWNSQAMWRKNTFGGYGVDINRNYPYEWNTCNGSSGQLNAQDYRGASAGSEEETNALMDLASRIKPVINLSFHSFSEMVIFPYGCPGKKPGPAELQVLTTVGKELANKTTRDTGSGKYAYGHSYQLLYPTDGGSIDWMAGKLGALAYVLEVNSTTQGFQPSYSKWRDITVERLRPAWQYALDRLSGPSLRVEAAVDATVRVENMSGEVVFEKKTDDLGWAHFVLFPGDYQVHSGTRASRKVTVGTSTAVVSLQ